MTRAGAWLRWAARNAAASAAAARRRRRRREPYVPQLDVPLWRGTDQPPPCLGTAHGECLRRCMVSCVALDEALADQQQAAAAGWYEDGGNLADHLPAPRAVWNVDGPLTESLAGAILLLANTHDETGARYWLAVCARRGAPMDMLAALWGAWLALHNPDPGPGGDDPNR